MGSNPTNHLMKVTEMMDEIIEDMFFFDNVDPEVIVEELEW